MANTKQAQKYIRKTIKRTEHNRRISSRLKTLQKKVTAEKDNPQAAKEVAIEFTSALDKAAKRGTIHRNKANRLKSKVAKLVLQKA